MTIRVRFAPSPTGHLHIGNVRTALYNWLFARQNQGVFILRLEDTDVVRSEKEFEEQLIEDLRWLRLDWDEGIEVGGEYAPYRQSERTARYREYAARLLDEGTAYHCFCSAEELNVERQAQLDAGRAPRYSGMCRSIPPEEAKSRVEAGERAALRLKVRPGRAGFNDLVFGPLEVQSSEIGDFIILRSDGSAPYNFACVVDDAQMQISHVIRGEGHISNAYRQVLIYESLGLPTPHFAHLSTIVGKDGSKLSKRHGAASIDGFRQRGYLPDALVNYIALLGWAPREEGHEILSRQELVSAFDLSRVNRSPAAFDWEKLNWVNRSHLKRLDEGQIVELSLPYFQRQGWIPDAPSAEIKEWLAEVIDAVFKYVDTLEDLPREARPVFEFKLQTLSSAGIREILQADGARDVIRAFYSRIEKYEELSSQDYKAVLEEVVKTTGRKGRELFHPVRVALTAQSSGPELEKLIAIFERGKQLELPVQIPGVKERVEAVLKRLE